MHRCLKCKKEYDNLDDIADGCSCGSKVFVFSNGDDKKQNQSLQEQQPVVPRASAHIENPPNLSYTGSNIKQKIFPPLSTSLQDESDDIDIPTSVASALISDDSEHQEDPSQDYEEVWLSKGGNITKIDKNNAKESGFDIENVYQSNKGIYEVDINGLKENPLVVKDSDGVYHIRLPFANIFFDNKNQNED
jgi:predicted  nucleic acid-binding Zn-ribbon protein